MIRRDHPALVALRKAAVAWATASREPVPDARDRAFRRVDQKLRAAARHFVVAEERDRSGLKLRHATRPTVLLPGGIVARSHSVKCYRPGCRRRKYGYLAITDHTGQFLDRMGRTLANLREQDFACAEHGVGNPEFLVRDTDA